MTARGDERAARFSYSRDQTTEGSRLFSPSFARNAPPMIARLALLLQGRPGAVLEIGAGTGQHAAAFALAFPERAWWPSDPDPAHRRSISAWAAELRAPARDSLDIDAVLPGWPEAAAHLRPLAAILSMNVLHIAPWEVAQGLIAGAARLLDPGGLLLLYGPFHENGRPTGPGNAAFDQSLRARNPDWGIRDVGDLAALATAQGFAAPEGQVMPADNRLLVFRRR